MAFNEVGLQDQRLIRAVPPDLETQTAPCSVTVEYADFSLYSIRLCAGVLHGSISGVMHTWRAISFRRLSQPTPSCVTSPTILGLKTKLKRTSQGSEIRRGVGYEHRIAIAIHTSPGKALDAQKAKRGSISSRSPLLSIIVLCTSVCTSSISA